MNSAKNQLTRYRQFLKTIPLAEFREKFQKVKWVEQDLPEEILPLASIFKYYWETQNFLDFDSWFDCFWRELQASEKTVTVLKEFKKYYFDKDDNGWFKRGFKARMYRTWVSMLTQLDLCYMLAYVAERKNEVFDLECNADLDKKGIDLKIGEIGLQVKKVSQRKEARTAATTKKKGGIKVITIPYPVYDIKEMERKAESSRVTPENRKAYKRTLQSFHQYCEMLNNGFVVFGENYAVPIVENINNLERLRKEIKQISSELAGEI